ncbi:Armadillo repeat-containing protein 8 [Tetrabaena socialis]|uniref:tRNA (guanine(9)-N(1))-methyltransferase n=1 Tax=Tetrabaena socialis TaxID=47790 RepID=A0A2J7ZTH8_9CHLO|nr:Armadillo repeat-containing protein 8 [Tetrabaena socialis]|eukprot:PNH03558.1 Armadillo repeat-containing protein 8 [Tetrabaena socialis]
MVARPRELLNELRAADTDRLKCLKKIKNLVIGNKQKKADFINSGAVQDVMDVLRSCAGPHEHSSSEVQKQAAVVLGSLAYGTEAGLRELLDAGGLPALLAMLHSGDPTVVEAGLRAVKIVLQQKWYGRNPGATGSARLGADAIAVVVRCLDATGPTVSGPPATAPTAATADPATATAGAPDGGVGPGGGAGLASMAATVIACCCCHQEESLESGPRIVIDLDFEEQMTESDIRHLVQQLGFSYSANKQVERPAHLYFTSFKGGVATAANRMISGMENWFVTRTEQSYTEVFGSPEDRQNLVYLTADSNEELEAGGGAGCGRAQRGTRAGTGHRGEHTAE